MGKEIVQAAVEEGFPPGLFQGEGPFPYVIANAWHSFETKFTRHLRRIRPDSRPPYVTGITWAICGKNINADSEAPLTDWMLRRDNTWCESCDRYVREELAERDRKAGR